MKTDYAEGMALITGATSGIGRELTKLFAADNYDLILIARNKDELVNFAKELQGKHDIFIKVIAKDLSTPDAAKEIYNELQKEEITIDVLVNSAGFATRGKYWEIDYAEDLQQIQLNITSLAMLTKLLLPQMVEQKSGKILNIASVAAFYPGPLMSIYYASKAFVLSFSEGLREELRGTGVTVTVLAPGPTRTGFAKRAGLLSSKLFHMKLMDPKIVAQIGYEGLMAGRDLVISGWGNKIQAFASRLSPYALSARVIKRLQQ